MDNIKRIIKENILRFGVYVVLYLILFAIFIPMLKYATGWGESMWYPYISCNPDVPKESFWQIFNSEAHGWFVMSFIDVFTNRYMPILLNMHHQDYMSKYNIYFILFVYEIFLISLLYNFEKYFKNKIFSCLLIFLIAPVAIIIQYLSNGEGNLWWFNHDMWFYPYILLPVFPILLFSILEKYFVTEQKTFTLKEKFILTILILLTGVSHEYWWFLLLCSLPLCFILNNLFVSNKIKWSSFLKFYISICSINIILLLNKQRMVWFETKDRSLSEITDIFIPYMHQYLHTVIIDNLWFIIPTVLLLVSLYLYEKSDRVKRLIIYCFSFFAAVLLFNFLIIAGTEEYKFSCMHPGVIFSTRIAFLCIIFSILGFFFHNIQNLKGKCIIAVSLIIPLIIYIYFHLFCFDVIPLANNDKDLKKQLYIIEKLFVLKSLENKTIYLPIGGHFSDFIITEYLFFYDNVDNYDEYKIERVPVYDLDYKSFVKYAEDNLGITITEEELDKSHFGEITKLYKSMKEKD